MSMVTLYELYYSVAAVEDKDESNRLKALIDSYIRYFSVLPLNQNGAEKFGTIKTAYRKHAGINQKALERHNIDFIIAGSALAENAVLVSNDNIFENLKVIVPELRQEN